MMCKSLYNETLSNFNCFKCISLTDLNNMEYQPVRVRGQFLHDKEIYIGPRSLIEPEEQKKGLLTMKPKSGYLVVTPFQLEGRE